MQAAAIFDHVHGAQGKMGGACPVEVSVDVTNGPKKLAVLPGQAQIALSESLSRSFQLVCFPNIGDLS